MKKIIDWVKRWSLLLMILVAGVGYLTICDNWSVYVTPLRQIAECFRADVMLLPEEEPLTVGAEEIGTEESITEEVQVQDDTQSISTDEVESQIEEPLQNASGEQGVVYTFVEDDYFQDAVFIGDSRTVGMYEYGELEETATFYASTGLTVYKMFDAPIVTVEGQKQKITIEQALSERSFSKIYLMIGINEMGTGTVDSFMEAYADAVDHLRVLQPDAIIYLQGIMKVTTERSGQGDYITNEGIEERNQKIAQLADDVDVYYLDVNPLICDDTGGMEPSYTFDGVHLKAQYISIWKDYLKSHAVDKVLLD